MKTTFLFLLCSLTCTSRDTEGLQIKMNPFTSTFGLPSIYISPLVGSCICCKLVSDLLKLDILVTKPSAHFPRLKGGSLSLFGTQPLCLARPSAISSIIHAEADVHNAELFIWSGQQEVAK